MTLPYAFNGDEAFRKDIVDLTDTIVWYRKRFTGSVDLADRKCFIEFEGVRQGADFYLNGRHLGFSENGVMACGFDLTPYIIKGENVLAVRCDNSWTYRSRQHDSRYQWNDRNFNANYGGIPKNVFLHVTDKLYQTLPLYSNLGTTGTYIYATDFDIAGHKAVIHAESQVRNEDTKARSFRSCCVRRCWMPTATRWPVASRANQGSGRSALLVVGLWLSLYGKDQLARGGPEMTCVRPSSSAQASARPASARARYGSTTAC